MTTRDRANTPDAASRQGTGNPRFVVEKHSIDYIPDSLRHGRSRDMFPMWFGANCMVVTVATGVLATSFGLSLGWTLVAMALGIVLGAVFMASHSAQGPQLGLPQMIQSRAQFGFFGANLPLVIVLLMYLGYFASGAVLGGQAVAALLGVPLTVGIVAVSLGNVVLALLGYRVIHAFERWFTPLAIVVFVLFSIALFTSTPPASHATTGGFATAPFLLVVAVVAIYPLTYAPYVADYSRYLPRRSGVAATFWYTFAGVVASGFWLMALGALLGNRYPQLSVIDQIRTVAVSWGSDFEAVVLLVVALGILGINSLNIYGGFMSSLTIATSYARNWTPTLALRVWFIVPVGVVATGLALLEKDHFLTSYEAFLSFLLYFMVPWTAVNLVDFYLVRHGSYEVSDMFAAHGRYGRIQWPGMLSYLVGCACQVPFVNVDFFLGPVARMLGGGDIAWIVGLVVPGACYLLLARRQLAAEQQRLETHG